MKLELRQMMEKKKISHVITIITFIVMLIFCAYKIIFGGALIDFIRVGVV